MRYTSTVMMMVMVFWVTIGHGGEPANTDMAKLVDGVRVKGPFDGTLEKVVNSIAKQTGIDILIADDVDAKTRVTHRQKEGQALFILMDITKQANAGVLPSPDGKISIISAEITPDEDIKIVDGMSVTERRMKQLMESPVEPMFFDLSPYLTVTDAGERFQQALNLSIVLGAARATVDHPNQNGESDLKLKNEAPVFEMTLCKHNKTIWSKLMRDLKSRKFTPNQKPGRWFHVFDLRGNKGYNVDKRHENADITEFSRDRMYEMCRNFDTFEWNGLLIVFTSNTVAKAIKGDVDKLTTVKEKSDNK